MSKLLITGGAGFIGSNFIHYWLRTHPEDEIVNLDKLTYAGHLESLKDIEDDPRYTFIKGDIADEDVVGKAMEGVDVVVNFAAESHVDRSNVDPVPFARTNELGTVILLKWARLAKIKRFHHISTDEVYGDLQLEDPPFNEETVYNPHTHYAASKAGSDLHVKVAFETYGLPVTITNCANNYGPYQDPEKLIPRFITNLLQGEKVPLMGKGENVREWLHVEDHCRGIDLVLEKGQPGETYLLQGEERANIEVTRAILKYLGMDEDRIEFVGDRLSHDFRYANDGSKIVALGWERQHSFDEDLEETIKWYQQNESWWKPLKTGRPNVDRTGQKGYNG